MNNQIPDKLSTICDSLFEKAVDEAIEQHRIHGEAIAISQEGKVKIVPAEEIPTMTEKLRQRKARKQLRS